MRIAICEDEPSQQRKLEALIREINKSVDLFIGIFDSGEALVCCYLEGERFDLIFMDIRMKELDGIETAKTIRQWDDDVKIILTTSIVEFAIKGYGIKAFDFILKPITKKNLKPVYERATQELWRIDSEIYCINISVGKTFIPMHEIIYFESVGRQVQIHTKYHIYKYYAKLSEEILKLNNSNFIRTHKSFIVNLKYLSTIKFTELELKNGKIIPISRGKYKEIYDEFTGFLVGRK